VGSGAILGRYIPMLKGMTSEQLKAGAAFEKAKILFGGFAELSAQSTTGALAIMGHAFEEFQERVGAAFNEFLGPIAVGLKGYFKELAESLGEDTKAFEQLTTMFRTGFTAAHSAVKFLIEAFYQVKIGLSGIGVGLAYVQQYYVALGTYSMQVLQEMNAALNRIMQGVAEFIANIPFLSEGMKQAMQGVADNYQAQVRSSEASIASMGQMREAAAAVVAERKKEVLVAQNTLAAIKANVATENVLLNIVTDVYNAKAKETTLEKALRAEKEQQLADEMHSQRINNERVETMKKRLAVLREITGVEGIGYKSAAWRTSSAAPPGTRARRPMPRRRWPVELVAGVRQRGPRC
jgi:hypothetical protein